MSIDKSKLAIGINTRRMKRKSEAMTKFEKFHADRIAKIGCLICGMPACIHHLLHCLWARIKRDHDAIVPLCWEHHQGNQGVHTNGNERKFFLDWQYFLKHSAEKWALWAKCEDVYQWAQEQHNESVRLYHA